MAADTIGFIHELRYADLPEAVAEQARRCLCDLAGTAAAGTSTALSGIIRGHAVRNYGGGRARLVFDGREVSPPGAALANAATIDSMDAHDGHRLAKGHAGAAVLPAALACLDSERGGEELLTSLVVGYEVATRVGIALHAAVAEYHSSGAWNALGAAAVGARALGLGRSATAHALGAAEYHGPRAPMMRCIDHPTMVKDSSAWGAHSGVSAVLLAVEGFTGAPAVLLGAGAPEEVWADLGTRWRVMEQYFKPYPVCRWSHPAVRAAIDLTVAHRPAPEEIRRIEVAAFHAATRLAVRTPATTEEAQYSLPFPVAIAAVHGSLPPDLVAHPDRAGEQVRRLARGMRITESAELTALFPAVRRAEVSLELLGGTRLESGPTEAGGDPEHPLPDAELHAKFRAAAVPLLGEGRARRLLDLLRTAEEHSIGEVTGELSRPPRH